MAGIEHRYCLSTNSPYAKQGMTGMSENNSNQVAGNCGPACEGESLIIEVIGKEHPEGHSFRIFDETN